MLPGTARVALLIPVLLGTSLVSARAADTRELRWQFRKGQTYKYLVHHHEVRTSELADQKFETTTESDYEWHWKVDSIEDQGTATLTWKLGRLRVTTSGKDFDFTYDSMGQNRSDEEYRTRLINLYNQLRHASFQVKLKPSGQVVEIRGFDKVLNDIEAADVKAFHAVNLHDESFAFFLQQTLGVLPETKVSSDARWEVPFRSTWTGLAETRGKWEFQRGKPALVGKHSCETIAWKGEESFDVDMTFVQSPLKGTLKSSQLGGKVSFDAKAGLVRASESKSLISGTLKLGDGEKPLPIKVTFVHKLQLEYLP